MTQANRRTILAAGAGGAAASVAAGYTWLSGRAVAASGATTEGTGVGLASDPTGSSTVPFRGAHQAGIITPAQDRLHFVALDVLTTDATALRAMLATWTAAAERMTRGEEAAPNGATGLGAWDVPTDTGEALGLAPGNLTITIGYGPSLFDDRFGLAPRRPTALAELPAFAGDDLDPARSGGDLCIQACADDPQVAVHAVRNLIRLGTGVVAVRWSQLGFGRTSSTSSSQVTPRNLFGFKDGTANLTAEQPEALAEHVWVAASDNPSAAAWMTGGSYLVARRIRMHIEVWDRSPLADQEQTIGRDKRTGAPLGSTREHDRPNFAATADGQPVIPVTSHVHLAHPDQLAGVQILRRGYNFTDGTDGQGHLDAGLFFLAYQRDPGRQFVPMQRALARADRLNEYIEHTGSAVFACPPGLAAGQDWGSQLLG